MEHKDRRTGLILFGILQLLIGLFQGLMALLMASASLLAARSGPGVLPPRMAVSIGLLYGAIGAGFITLGIGSMMARRWARALILVLSWMWLITGVLGSLSMFVTLPKMLASLPPEQAAAKPIMIGCMAVVSGLFFILLPLAFVLFYRSPNVKATVEVRDPVRRWTDDVPLPLLAFGVWLVGGGAAVALCAFIYPSLPVGPWMLRGAAVSAVMICFAVAMLFIGVGALKQKKSAWWAALALFLVGTAYSIIFPMRTNFTAWYREMGMATDPNQIAMMEAMYSGPYFYVWIGIVCTGYFAFLFYLRRFIFTDRLSFPNT